MTIKDVMDSHCKHLKIDGALARKISAFLTHFKNKNQDHVNALGSNLLGVYPMRWIPSVDQNEWCENLLEIDRLALRQDIVALDTVDENWKRATDVVNLTCVWLAHRFFNSNLPIRAKEQVVMDVLMVYHCKIFSSLLAHYFPYGVDEGIAAAVYADLSKKFEIKRKGTWQRVLESGCEDIVAEDSIHYQTIQRFDDDQAVIYLISDTQLKVRSKFKYIWEVLDKVRATNQRFVSVGSTVELNGEFHIRDLERVIPKYKRYIEDVCGEVNRFYKADLADVVSSVMPTMNENMFAQVLNTYSQAFGNRHKEARSILDLTIEHLFNSVLTDPEINGQLKNIVEVVSRTRGLYTSSRSTDPALMQMRKLGEKFIKKECKINSPTQLSALRTGLLLYIVLRTMAMNHYS
jgi:hypothetical protein